MRDEQDVEEQALDEACLVSDTDMLSGSVLSSANVQGMGMTCKEELIWGDAEHAWLPRGHLQTRGPGRAYALKIWNS